MPELQDVVESGVYPFPNILPTKSITANYTVDPDTDYGLVVAATAADITITLPLYSELVGKPYQILEIIPIVANGYKVRIACGGADTFPFGNTWFDLPAAQKQFSLGLHEHGFNLRRNITLNATYVRTTAWAASNFSGPVALPFETEIDNNQPELIEWTTTSRVTVKSAAVWNIFGGFSINSTGGGTWNAQIELRKNGVYEPFSRVVTGNYGGEDDSIFGFMDIDCVANDYLELFIDQTNLTGELLTSKCSIQTIL